MSARPRSAACAAPLRYARGPAPPAPPLALALAVGLVLGLALAGCGSHAESQRAQVAAYLKRVARIEHAEDKPLAELAKAGAVLQQEQGQTHASLINSLAGAASAAPLERAGAQMVELRNELAAIPAPSAATHLRALLLELANRQTSLGGELANLALFLPRFDAALSRLGPMTSTLRDALAQPAVSGAAAVAAAYAFKAGALRRFARAVNGISASLRAARPPALWAPAYQTEMASLRGMRASAVSLASALEAGATGDFGQLMLSFDRAATLSQTIAAQRARIHAVKVYDAEVEAQGRLAAAIESERVRLDATLPQ